MCGVLAQPHNRVLMSAQDAAASAPRTGTQDPPHPVVRDFPESREDSPAIAVSPVSTFSIARGGAFRTTLMSLRSAARSRGGWIRQPQR